MQIHAEEIVVSLTVTVSTYHRYNEYRHYGASTHCAHLRTRDIVGMRADTHSIVS